MPASASQPTASWWPSAAFSPLRPASPRDGSRHLRYPRVSSRVVPVRPERHVPHSIASIRRRLAVGLVRMLPRWFCQHSCQTRRREVKAEFSLRCFENSEHTAGTTEVKQATAAGGDVLVVASARAEEVAELVVASTEALGRGEALEPAPTPRAPFHAPVVLLQSVVL